jgi:hypothetical protein
VWPDRIVERNNLAAQISQLRKLFAPDGHLIRTVAGRGYQFTGDIRTTPATAGPPLWAMSNLPASVSESIGREGELQAVAALAVEHRLVSLVGPGASATRDWSWRSRGIFCRDFPTGSSSPSSARCRVLTFVDR